MDTREEVARLLARHPFAEGSLLPAPAGADAIAGLEHRLGFALPEEFKDWLRLCNGCDAELGWLLGIHPEAHWIDIESTIGAEKSWAHHRLVPVGEDGCGGIHLLDCSDASAPFHPVVYADPAGWAEPAYVMASSIWRHVRIHLESGYAMLTENRDIGPYTREQFLYWDPDIEKCRASGPMLWETCPPGCTHGRNS